MDSTFSQTNSSTLYSPYLSIDPAYLNATGGEYILPATPSRGQFEQAFTQIGTCVLAGGAIGGFKGILEGLSETKKLEGSVKRSQMINCCMKGSSTVANRVGTVSVIYSTCEIVLRNLRDKDDGVNTAFSGALTGLLFQSTSGWKKCGLGGLAGLCLASAYAFTKGNFSNASNR